MMNSTPTESQDQKKIKPTPFKLCFVSQKEPGRSNIQIGKPLDFVQILTPKFYAANQFKYDKIDEKMGKLISKYPKEKYDAPLTQNQQYGWYEPNYSTDPVIMEYLNFRKREKQFIKEHLMIYEKIRE